MTFSVECGALIIHWTETSSDWHSGYPVDFERGLVVSGPDALRLCQFLIDYQSEIKSEIAKSTDVRREYVEKQIAVLQQELNGLRKDSVPSR